MPSTTLPQLSPNLNYTLASQNKPTVSPWESQGNTGYSQGSAQGSDVSTANPNGAWGSNASDGGMQWSLPEEGFQKSSTNITTPSANAWTSNGTVNPQNTGVSNTFDLSAYLNQGMLDSGANPGTAANKGVPPSGLFVTPASQALNQPMLSLNQPTLLFGHAEKKEPADAAPAEPQKGGIGTKFNNFFFRPKTWGVINNPVVWGAIGVGAGLASFGVGMIVTVPVALVLGILFHSSAKPGATSAADAEAAEEAADAADEAATEEKAPGTEAAAKPPINVVSEKDVKADKAASKTVGVDKATDAGETSSVEEADATVSSEAGSGEAIDLSNKTIAKTLKSDAAKAQFLQVVNQLLVTGSVAISKKGVQVEGANADNLVYVKVAADDAEGDSKKAKAKAKEMASQSPHVMRYVAGLYAQLLSQAPDQQEETLKALRDVALADIKKSKRDDVKSEVAELRDGFDTDDASNWYTATAQLLSLTGDSKKAKKFGDKIDGLDLATEGDGDFGAALTDLAKAFAAKGGVNEKKREKAELDLLKAVAQTSENDTLTQAIESAVKLSQDKKVKSAKKLFDGKGKKVDKQRDSYKDYLQKLTGDEAAPERSVLLGNLRTVLANQDKLSPQGAVVLHALNALSTTGEGTAPKVLKADQLETVYKQAGKFYALATYLAKKDKLEELQSALNGSAPAAE